MTLAGTTSTAVAGGPLAADGSPHRARRTRRDWVVDSVVFLVAGLASLLTLALSTVPVEGSGFRRPSEAELWLDVVLGLACLVALWWRRRYPVTLAVLTAFAAVLSAFAGGPATVMLLTVAVHRRWPWALLVGAVNVVASLVFVLWWGDETMGWLAWLTITGFGTLLTVALIGFGMFLRARRQLLATLRERADRAEAEQRRAADAARQGERTRIAREMHDVLAHRISLVSMHAGALEYRGDASPEEVATAAGVIRDNAHRALVDLREVIGVLRGGEAGTDSDDGTSTSRPQPTLDELDGLLEETRAAGITVRAEVDLADVPLPATTGRTAYRVLQEGLTNARKHGRGAAVTVCVRGTPADGLALEVRNSLRPGAIAAAGAGAPRGAGATWTTGTTRTTGATTGATPGATPGGAPAGGPVPGSGVGLVGLAERTRLAGGSWEHGVVDDVFRLHVWLPWPAEDGR
ncbi:sensor histidine kinase [Aquipuribacter hungaricus]|uniref:histidine kinase n=3 Tax=Aquipuribacter hungaricus TaxID=545624 RepID=A0ABV7WIN5_9MICO